MTTKAHFLSSVNGMRTSPSRSTQIDQSRRLPTVFYVAVYISIIFAHFEVISVSGAPITITFLLVPFLMVPFLRLREPTAGSLCLLSALLLLPLVACLIDEDTTLFVFMKTYTLFVIAAAIIFVGIYTKSFHVFQDQRFESALKLALITISILSVLQVAAGSFGSELFFNPWRGHQFAYQYEPNIRYFPVPRAAGFYLEPSYNAFVLLATWVALSTRRDRFDLSFTVIAFAGLFATRSATGLGIFMLILGVAAVKSRQTRLVVPVLLAAIFAGGYLLARFDSIGQSGSSGNYRYLAPLRVLSFVLDTRPLGMPLGSVQQTVQQFDILNGASYGVTLDNGFYVLIFYYGWIGLVAATVLCCVGLFWVVKPARSAGRRLVWVSPFWLVASLLFSGGIMSTEFVWFSFLAFVASLSSVSPKEI